MKTGFLALVVFAAVALTAGAALAAQAGPWIMTMDKDGIRAYAREVPGTNLKEVRAVMTVDAPLETINAVMRDVPGLAGWFSHCSKSEMVQERSKLELDTYVLLGMPWPVQDRDMVVNSKIVYDTKTGRGMVNLKAVDDPRRPPSKPIRIKDFKGKYVFEFISRDKTGVIFTFTLDLGGWIPVSILNIMGKYSLYDTFMGMRRMVKKPAYIEAGKHSEEHDLVDRVLADDSRVREVFKNRLSEFIGDKDFVERVTEDPGMRDRFFSSKNGLAEILLYGWGSEKSKKEAISKLLLVYLPRHIADPKAAEKLATDKELVEAILTGKTPAQKILEARNCGFK